MEEAQSLTGITYSVEEKVADLTARLRAKFGIDKAFLFGSSAKGTRLQESDIDLILVSEGFEGMPMPERQGAVQKEWNHPEELQTLTYTPAEFSEVSKRLTMREILSSALDVSPLRGRHVCPKCGRKGSLQTKIVKNKTGKSYPFLYFAHYTRGKVRWCYLGPPKHFRGLVPTGSQRGSLPKLKPFTRDKIDRSD